MLLLQRSALLLAVLLAVAAAAVNLQLPHLVPAEAQSAFNAVLSAKPKLGSLVPVLASLYWASLLAALGGLWLLRPWGLWLALVATLAAFAQAALLGPHAYSGPAYAVAYLSKVLWGLGLGVSLVLTLKPRSGA